MKRFFGKIFKKERPFNNNNERFEETGINTYSAFYDMNGFNR
ncbi:MAG TPA: hypothetical protein P5107_10045 [Thermotogota bacterium]|nr:hypothetical protein [Thermotogota bacterium]HPF16607.1 hypothetical protein [Thermotogota bacterium]HRW35383.1 hypothetical protein [Thermotogota bacterium]